MEFVSLEDFEAQMEKFMLKYPQLIFDKIKDNKYLFTIESKIKNKIEIIPAEQSLIYVSGYQTYTHFRRYSLAYKHINDLLFVIIDELPKFGSNEIRQLMNSVTRIAEKNSIAKVY